jgi:hypothetical protein
MKNNVVKVAEEDLMEYNLWIKSKLKKKPRLLKKFKNIIEYEKCIEEAQDKWMEDNFSKDSN